MRPASLLAVLGVAALCMVGCADKRVTLSYQPSSILAPIGQPQPLTIRGFNDRRGDESDGDPTRVGGIYGGYGNRLSKVMADSPLMLTLLNALAEGFKARGVPVTVIVAPLSPGVALSPGAILTGRSQELLHGGPFHQLRAHQRHRSALRVRRVRPRGKRGLRAGPLRSGRWRWCLHRRQRPGADHERGAREVCRARRHRS